MRKLLCIAILPTICLYATKTMAANLPVIDSVKIAHVTDGNISEWPADKFEQDKDTQVSYSVDHDANNMYIGMKVADPKTQMKMMMQGMSLFIDKNGKKRERMGVEFPVKREMDRSSFSRGDAAPDPKEVRDQLASTMIFLKTFGFDGQEDKTQLVAQPDGVNVAFAFDGANNMYIEYTVPISLLGSTASLNGKPLGIGWRIFGMSAAAAQPTSVSTQLVAVPSGGRGAGGGSSGRGAGAGSNNSRSADMGAASDPRFKDQTMWTKYTLTF